MTPEHAARITAAGWRVLSEQVDANEVAHTLRRGDTEVTLFAVDGEPPCVAANGAPAAIVEAIHLLTEEVLTDE